MVDLAPEHLAEVLRILADTVPDLDVWAFGSRVTGRCVPASDLDLVLVGTSELDWKLVERIKDAFSDSNLPFMVDVLDWQAIDESFIRIIRQQYVVLQERTA